MEHGNHRNNKIVFVVPNLHFKLHYLFQNTVEPLITVIFAQESPPDMKSVEKVPAKIMVKLSLKNLPTAVTSNQRPNGSLTLSQCLILPLLTVKQALFCKQMKGKIEKGFFVLFGKRTFFKN